MEGHEQGDGSKTNAAVLKFAPEIRDYAGLQERIRGALAGWSKRAPQQSRKPPPENIVYAVAGQLCRMRRPDVALAVLTQFDTYMRPGELLSIPAQDFLTPRGFVVGEKYGFLIHPMLGATPGKTGEYDESVLLDEKSLDWLGPQLAILKSGKQAHETLFSFGPLEYHKVFSQAADQLGLSAHHLVPYSLRHAGPSVDALSGRRSLAEIKARGRWRSDTSVRRYAKAARILSEASEFDSQILLFGEQVKEVIREHFLRGVALPPPPPR